MAEGLFDPLLKNLTYDPGAAYDDAWLQDTLHDAAVGAVLGGIGGAADAGVDAGADADIVRKQKDPASEPEVKPLRVGRVTTIQRPYTGPTPVQTQTSGVVPEVSAVSVKKATDDILLALQEEQANGGKGFKVSLTNLLFDRFIRSPGVPVSGMNFQGKPYLVEIGNNVPGKIVSDRNLSAEKLALLDVLPEVVRNAEYVGSGEYVQHSAKIRPVVRYDYFETSVDIGGKPYIAKFDVEVFPGANNYRTHQIVNVDLMPPKASLTGPSARGFL